MLLLLSWYKFSDEKMQDSDAFYECVTDRQTNRPTDRPTDTAYYRDARTHLKMERWFMNGEMISHIACIFKKWRDGSIMER